MNKASAKTNRSLITSPCGDALEVSLVSPPLLTAARLMSPSHPESKHVTQFTSEQYAPPGLVTPPKIGSASANSRNQIEKHRLIIVGLSSIQSEVIAHLCRQADTAYMLRQLDKVDAIGRQLKEAHAAIGSYYIGLAAQRFGLGDLDHAQRQLEYAAEYAPQKYMARAFLILGSVCEYRKDYKAESEFYRLALNTNHSDIFTAVETRRAIAIRYFAEGELEKAIELLESLLPLASQSPFLKATLLNHLAVYYHAAGRLQDAARLSLIACASAFAGAHPELQETKVEIAAAIVEQEQRPLIIAAPQVQVEQKEDKKEAREHFVPLILALSTVDSDPPRVLLTVAKTSSLIQSRVYSCAPIHGPPSPFRK
jgi:tetratricopeptide (TPR) repeat protein